MEPHDPQEDCSEFMVLMDAAWSNLVVQDVGAGYAQYATSILESAELIEIGDEVWGVIRDNFLRTRYKVLLSIMHEDHILVIE